MCELLVKAVDYTHPDPIKDRRGAYKRGYIVEIRPDGAEYGTEERLPKFVVIKVPTVSIERAMKYMMTENEDGTDLVYRRRRWQIRWNDLPAAARNKLAHNGELIIKVPAYDGPYDYTWQQVKQYFRDLKTGLDENEDL